MGIKPLFKMGQRLSPPVAENHVVDVITKSYKDAIVRLYEEGNIEAMRQKSYDLAKGFLTSQVKAA